MMNPSLRAHVERLAQGLAARPAPSGSRDILVLGAERPARMLDTISIARRLVRSGASVVEAKRAVDDLVDEGFARVAVAAGEGVPDLIAELGAMNVAAVIGTQPASLSKAG